MFLTHPGERTYQRALWLDSALMRRRYRNGYGPRNCKCHCGGWTETDCSSSNSALGLLYGSRSHHAKGPHRIPQVAAFCGLLLDSTTTLHHARVGNFPVQPSTTHHHQLKQRDPATSVAEPCSIPVVRACRPLPSRWTCICQ